MVNYYIYAKDCSSSAEGHEYYNTNGLKTLQKFKNDVDRIKEELMSAGEPPMESKIIYLHWGYTCYNVAEVTVVKSYEEQNGGLWCTDPSKIIKWIKGNNICGRNNRIKLMYIITDGLIESADIRNCFRLNKKLQYDTVVFHAFNDNLSEIDLSVAASFFKSRCIVNRNNEVIDDIDVSQEFDYNKITIDNFATEINSLKSYIRFKFIGTSKQDAVALQEIDKLKKLRDRLLEGVSFKSQKIEVNLETKERNVFLQEFAKTNWCKSSYALDQNAKVDIEKSISTLIDYIVTFEKSYSFDGLNIDIKFGNLIEEEVIDVNSPAEQEVELPNVLDGREEICIIILQKFNFLDKLIYHEKKESAQISPADFRKFKSAMECPLFLMKDQQVEELKLMPVRSLNKYETFLEIVKEQLQLQKLFTGGLVLTDTDLFDNYNDYILSATYFDGKKVNFNIGLFYFVLWKNFESNEKATENVKEEFKKYVMRRISTTICKIGLSSSPLYPQENVSLPTALRYCVEMSSCIFKDDPQNFMQERMRTFYPVANWMIEILEYFNYDLDLESIEKRRELIKCVMILKDIPTHREKVYYLLEEIFKKINGFLVSEIEKPFNLYKLNYLKFNHEERLSYNILEEKVNLNDYIHLMPFIGDLNGGSLVKINKEKSCSCITINVDKSFAENQLEVTRKIVIMNADNEETINASFEERDSDDIHDIHSLYKLFFDFLQNYKKFPTLPEYQEYVSEKKRFNGELVTIFSPYVCVEIQDIYLELQTVEEQFDNNEFAEFC